MKYAFLSILIVVALLASASVLVNRSNALENSTNSSSKEVVPATKLKVVTSVAPVANIIRNIGGDRIDLIGIIPEGSDSHTFDLVPSDVVKMNDADLVIIDGLHLEGGMEKVVDEAKNKNPQMQ